MNPRASRPRSPAHRRSSPDGPVAGYALTVRAGPRVDRERFESLDRALAELERRGREVEMSAGTGEVRMPLMRRFEPVQRVTARLELRGPGVRAGVDVRGDGSTEAYTGRLRRRVVEQRGGESAYWALRRVLGAEAPL